MWDGVLHREPVLDHGATFGGEDALGMELYAVDVEGAVAQSHYLTLVALCRYFKAVGELLLADHP